MPQYTPAEVMRGTWLEPFLREYRAGFKGPELYWWLYGKLKPLGLNRQQVSEVYRTYSGIAQTGMFQETLGPGEVPTYASMTVNAHFPVENKIAQHYVYIVDVKARVAGERSIHSRTVRITSNERLTNDEILQQLNASVPWTIYTRGGGLAAESIYGVGIIESEVIGAFRTY